MPTMQWEQRMVRIVSVSLGIMRSGSEERRLAGKIPDDNLAIRLKTKRIAGSHTGIEPKPAPTFRQVCRRAGRSDAANGRAPKRDSCHENGTGQNIKE
jgi:hypothetical protein